jgi:hypothetical protein
MRHENRAACGAAVLATSAVGHAAVVGAVADIPDNGIALTAYDAFANG